MNLSPFQARVLRDLNDGGVLVYGYRKHYILWRRHDAKYPRSVRVPKSTADLLTKAGLLIEVAGSRFPDNDLNISDKGKRVLSELPASAFNSTPRPKPAISARDIMALLHIRHRAPRFFIGDEFSVGRTVADAVAISLYHPYKTIAYEIKVSRGDFKREIANPRKNKDLFGMVDEFYYVCPAGLIDKKEVPPPAGLIYAWPGRLREARRFTSVTYMLDPKVSRELTASLLRRSGRSDRQAVRTAFLLAELVERWQKDHPGNTHWAGDWIGGLVRDAKRLKDEAVRAGIIDAQLRT